VGALESTPPASDESPLLRAGYRVVRVEASLVVRNIENALDRIRDAFGGLARSAPRFAE
jgi:hypothetical protein